MSDRSKLSTLHCIHTYADQFENQQSTLSYKCVILWIKETTNDAFHSAYKVKLAVLSSFEFEKNIKKYTLKKKEDKNNVPRNGVIFMSQKSLNS